MRALAAAAPSLCTTGVTARQTRPPAALVLGFSDRGDAASQLANSALDAPIQREFTRVLPRMLLQGLPEVA